MKIQCSTKGFTIVELMIVVAIIGILAAIAIPLHRKQMQDSGRTALLNDARQIGSAAQQYLTEKGAPSVNFIFATDSGVAQEPLSHYVSRVSKGYINGNITIVPDGTFSLQHPQVRGGFNGEGNLGDPVVFNASGQLRAN